MQFGALTCYYFYYYFFTIIFYKFYQVNVILTIITSIVLVCGKLVTNY